MGHRAIYVEKSEGLHLYLDNLKVDVNNAEMLFPISDIEILVIDNYKSNISVPLINKLMENNVCTVLCGIDHLPKTVILPMNGNFATSGNIAKQIIWNQSRKDILYAEIVKRKIYNQKEILKFNGKSEEVIAKLEEFIMTTQIKDSTNREGLAAKMYFRELFGPDFIRFEEDVVNAGLNYGYSIFRSLITSIIVAKGYLPNLGIFHIGKMNYFNLSDDVIEVFRPIVDNYVYKNMMQDILFKQEHKDALINLTTQKVKIDGRRQTIPNAINIYLDSIFHFLEDDVDELVFPEVTIFPNDL